MRRRGRCAPVDGLDCGAPGCCWAWQVGCPLASFCRHSASGGLSSLLSAPRRSGCQLATLKRLSHLQTLVSVSTIGTLDDLSEQQLIDKVKQVGTAGMRLGRWGQRSSCAPATTAAPEVQSSRCGAASLAIHTSCSSCCMLFSLPPRLSCHPAPRSPLAGAGWLVWSERGGELAAPEDLPHPLCAAQPGKSGCMHRAWSVAG